MRAAPDRAARSGGAAGTSGVLTPSITPCNCSRLNAARHSRAHGRSRPTHDRPRRERSQRCSARWTCPPHTRRQPLHRGLTTARPVAAASGGGRPTKQRVRPCGDNSRGLHDERDNERDGDHADEHEEGSERAVRDGEHRLNYEFDQRAHPSDRSPLNCPSAAFRRSRHRGSRPGSNPPGPFSRSGVAPARCE